MIKGKFDATLRRVRRTLRAQDRRIARHKREGRWPTEDQFRQQLALTPLVRSRGNQAAFRQRVLQFVKVEKPFPLIKVDRKIDGRRLPRRISGLNLKSRKELNRLLEELILGRLYIMPLRGMPKGIKSTEALFLRRPVSNKTLDRLQERVRKLTPRQAMALLDDNPGNALALMERCQREEKGSPPHGPKRHAQSYPAHVELVTQVKLLTGRYHYSALATLITAAHHVHGNRHYSLSAEALAKAYRRWLKGSPGGQR